MEVFRLKIEGEGCYIETINVENLKGINVVSKNIVSFVLKNGENLNFELCFKLTGQKSSIP